MELLLACAWCERVKLDQWVRPEVAIRDLRTYDWRSPPSFTHGICDDCLSEQLAARGLQRPAEAAASGSVSVNSVPRPAALSTVSVPPSA